MNNREVFEQSFNRTIYRVFPFFAIGTIIAIIAMMHTQNSRAGETARDPESVYMQVLEAQLHADVCLTFRARTIEECLPLIEGLYAPTLTPDPTISVIYTREAEQVNQMFATMTAEAITPEATESP